MSELETIRTVLQQAARRHRIAKALRGLAYGLFTGALLSLICLGLYHILPLPLWTLTLAPVLPVLGMLVGFVAGGWARPDLGRVAQWVDKSQSLKERLSTALEK